jgi:hypothetical protein
MNLVDASTWPAYFAGEPTVDFFAEAIEDTDLLVVPSGCFYEVFKVVLRERGENAAFSAVVSMHLYLDAGLAMQGAALGLEEELAFVDSVIFAVAKKHDAMLWTQDAHLKASPASSSKQRRLGNKKSLKLRNAGVPFRLSASRKM